MTLNTLIYIHKGIDELSFSLYVIVEKTVHYSFERFKICEKFRMIDASNNLE